MKTESLRAIDEGKLIRELVERNGLHEFIRQMWPTVEPATRFVDNWHIGAMAEALEALHRRQIKNLVINVPPGCQKSLTASVFFPAWAWSFDPGHRWIYGSYDPNLLIRDSRRMVQILESHQFHTAWPEFKLKDGKETLALGRFYNSHGGLRFSCTPGSAVTGWHANTCVIDDPLKAADARSEVANLNVKAWKAGTLGLRASDPKTYAFCLIMQRLSKMDLAEEMLEEGAEHLMLPQRYVPRAQWDRGCTLGKLDQRTTAGELLWPARMPEEVLQNRAKLLKTPNEVQAQEQQNPTPDTGGIIERPWIRKWSTDQEDKDRRLPPPFLMRWITSWDLSFEGDKDSQSRVAAALMATCKVNGQPRYFVVQCWARHLNYPQAKAEFRRLCRGKDPKTGNRFPALPWWQYANKHLIERKANGHALLQELKGEVPGLEPVNPRDSKGDRLILHSDKFRDGEVWLPPAAFCPQVDELENELVFFPNGDYDDLMDVVTQGLDKLGGANAAFWAALSKLKNGGK